MKDKYRDETNLDVYTDADNGEMGSYTDEYVKWLENLAQELVKNNAVLPLVSKRSELLFCEECKERHEHDIGENGYKYCWNCNHVAKL